MAMVLPLLSNAAITGTTTGAAVLTNATPFVDGRTAILKTSALGGTPTIIIETSDTSAFTVATTVATLNTANSVVGFIGEVQLQKYIRYRQTGAGTGNGSIFLEGVQ